MNEKQQLISEYKNLKPDLIFYFEKNNKDLDKVAEYCSLYGIPVIAAYTYISEEYFDYKTQCDNIINRLCIFYGITND